MGTLRDASHGAIVRTQGARGHRGAGWGHVPDQSRPWEQRGGEELLRLPHPTPHPGQEDACPDLPPKQLETPGSAGQAQLVSGILEANQIK